MTVRRITPADIKDPVTPAVQDEIGPTIGNIRKTPEVLTGIFTEVLRGLYMADNGLHLNKQWVWADKPADATSQVWINAEAVWNDTAPDFRPAIYVALTPLTYQTVTGQQRSRSGMTLPEAEYHYLRHGKGGVRFVHVCRSQGEASALMSNTLDLLDAFSDSIREDFCFRTLNVEQVTPPKVYEKEPRERFRGEIVMGFTFEDSWTIKLESPKLKRVVFDAGLRLSEVLGLQLRIM